MKPATPIESAFHQLRRLYWYSLCLALAVHLIFVLILITASTPKGTSVPEPAKVKFFTRRDPTLSKPLELRKIPQPKRQMIQRELQATAARMDQVRTIAAFDTRSLIAGQGSGGSGIGAPRRLEAEPRLSLGMEPGLKAEDLGGNRTGENKVDMALEMLDINSMDTGRYRAMVVQDADNRQNLKGFLKLANVVSIRAKNTGSGIVDLPLMGVICETLNNYTGLHAEFVGDFAYDDQRLLEVPIIFIDARYLAWAAHSMTPNEGELKNLAEYLVKGGFIIGPLTDPIMAGLEKYGGLVRGRDFWAARVPEDHPLFSSFFDIRGGAPAGSSPHIQWKWDSPHVLNGWFIKGRLVALNPEQGWGWENFHYPAENARQLQMAVNVIIYALTQEGSMTQRLMQMAN